MINYKDCPECGARKIRESVSLCEVCEIAQRYETRLEQLQAMLDAAIKECDAVRVERARLGEKLKKIENLSKNAWEQVNRNPVHSKELFWLIYHHSK
jgi:predicted nuclease with TOPRIM domain